MPDWPVPYSLSLYLCNGRKYQCTSHKLNMTRMFNSANDQYTLVTSFLPQYRCVTPYAGIPNTCELCIKDVIEHQTVHLMVHPNCKFCCQEARPFSKDTIIPSINVSRVITSNNYNYAIKYLKWREARTCSFCYIKLSDKYARIHHEEKVHREVKQKYKCDCCDRDFSNINSLNYHKVNKHGPGQNFPCQHCNKEFLLESNLKEHIKVAHENIPFLECEDCGKQFTVQRSLKRHRKEQHGFVNLNLDFATDEEFACDNCDAIFKRKDHLKRHKETTHSNFTVQNSFQCSSCDKSYSRSDALKRHKISKHS